MNEDYLWDKTGEADPDVELLEQQLSSLRFKRPAEPLPLPAVAPRRIFWHSFPRPVLAAAAALVALLLAGGLWLGLTGRGTVQTTAQDTRAEGSAPQAQPMESGPRPPIGPEPPQSVERGQEQNVPEIARKPRPRPRTQANSSGPRQLMVQRPAPRKVSPGREEVARGEAAKAQLIKALHIASDKLNEVQKKIQGNQEQRPIS